MHSVASAGATERITARILFKVVRAGSGTPARYSSTVLGAALRFPDELLDLDLVFFIVVTYKREFKGKPLTSKTEAITACWWIASRNIKPCLPAGSPFSRSWASERWPVTACRPQSANKTSWTDRAARSLFPSNPRPAPPRRTTSGKPHGPGFPQLRLLNPTPLEVPALQSQPHSGAKRQPASPSHRDTRDQQHRLCALPRAHEGANPGRHETSRATRAPPQDSG